VEIIIVAPHPDDELIGCYSVLKNSKHKPIIIYTEDVSEERKEEVKGIKKLFNIKHQLLTRQVPQNLMVKENLFYFPDPFHEHHPAHRMQGAIGETFARAGLNVMFYSTNMTAPYIHEVEHPEEKQNALNLCYPTQADLWKYEHKFFLFEGYCKWFL